MTFARPVRRCCSAEWTAPVEASRAKPPVLNAPGADGNLAGFTWMTTDHERLGFDVYGTLVFAEPGRLLPRPNGSGAFEVACSDPWVSDRRGCLCSSWRLPLP